MKITFTPVRPAPNAPAEHHHTDTGVVIRRRYYRWTDRDLRFCWAVYVPGERDPRAEGETLAQVRPAAVAAVEQLLAPALPTFTILVPGSAMSAIEGSDLYQNPDVYTSDPDRRAYAQRAAIALRQARPRRNGGGVSYPVTLDVLAAAVVRGYCDTVGSTFAAERGERETQAEGRSLLRVAARIAAATAGVGWSAPSPRDVPRPL